MNRNTDTICALATPAGKGGVSVIRLSGQCSAPLAKQIANRVPEHGKYCYCPLRDDSGSLIDQGLVLYFKAPHSFTGEDVIEFHCHGSPIVVDQLLQVLIKQGARLARPGEFSERAFLNDKIDLTQAEAIADLIDSNTVAAARHALRSLQGDFSKLINALVKQVINLRVYVEASIDFPEEEIDFLSQGNISGRLEELQAVLHQIQQQAQQGSILREGLRVVIAGAPNAGKSTLLNALSGQDIAIVTPIAGTTRDMLRQDIQIDGIPIHLIDTAGLRNSDDLVEQEGIRRAKEAITTADRVLLLVDVSQALELTTLPLWQELSVLVGERLTVVFNKIDLHNSIPQPQIIGKATLFISAQTKAGLDQLKAHLKLCAGYDPQAGGGFIARRRHLSALSVAAQHLEAAQHCLIHLKAGELVAEELRNVQTALDEITGKFSTDDLLGTIFSSFCIGK
jgi:tRNA modification GTPase